MFTFSHNSFIKNNPVPLFHKIIESMDAEEIKREFQEMENFKKRNWG
jgi:CO dehydrogenase/acetyl-CoA synthase gamma subunit (corrinoid Fe-S protein)